MKFCSECAHPLTQSIPEGDNRLRFVCPQCAAIHYQNPKLVVGSIPVWEHEGKFKILLCKRAIEPRAGFWTLPAGFMENEETTEEASLRETEEEAGANIDLHELFILLNIAHAHQVHLFYRATLRDLDFAPGTESLDVQLFDESEIPWNELAFPTITRTLELFLADHKRLRGDGPYPVHSIDIVRRMDLQD